MIRIAIADEQHWLPIDRVQIRRAVRTALHFGKIKDAEISVALVEDEAIHQVNRQFLGHDYATDVISFPLSESDERLEGELVISTETAVRVAQKIRQHCETWDAVGELMLYLTHGTLHLVGLDDHAPEDILAMRNAEAECLEKLGIPFDEGARIRS